MQRGKVRVDIETGIARTEESDQCTGLVAVERLARAFDPDQVLAPGGKHCFLILAGCDRCGLPSDLLLEILKLGHVEGATLVEKPHLQHFVRGVAGLLRVVGAGEFGFNPLNLCVECREFRALLIDVRLAECCIELGERLPGTNLLTDSDIDRADDGGFQWLDNDGRLVVRR